MKKRTLYDLSHQVITYGWFGELIPHCLLEVAPGDTFTGKTGQLTRLMPTKVPISQDINVESYFFYVPHRLVWDGWEDFLAAGPQDPNVTVPTIGVGEGALGANRQPWLRYNSRDTGGGNQSHSALRLRAYNLVWNEFFRDDEDDPISADFTQTSPLSVNFKKNYKTVIQGALQPGAKATASVTDDEVAAVDILRAIAEQKLAMKRATYGTRYVDILKSFGVSVNYQMLQRPELVGYGRGVISATDIAVTDSTNPGKLVGHAVGGQRLSIKRKSFPEHGTLIGLTVVRPEYILPKTIEWHDKPRDYSHYYDPALEPLPPVAATRSDIWVPAGATGATQIGFLPWGEWYRSAQSWARDQSFTSSWPDHFKAVDETLYEAGAITAPDIRLTNNIDSSPFASFASPELGSGRQFSIVATHRLRALRMIGPPSAMFSGST